MPDQPTDPTVTDAIAAMSDRQLVQTLRIGDRFARAAAVGVTVHDAPAPSGVRARLMDEIGRRWPAAAQAVRDAHESVEDARRASEDGATVPDVDEVAVLLAAVPAEVTA